MNWGVGTLVVAHSHGKCLYFYRHTFINSQVHLHGRQGLSQRYMENHLGRSLKQSRVL